MFFSLYKNGIKNVIPSETINVEEFLKLVKEDDNLIKRIRTKPDKKDRDLLKQRLSYVTFGGTFTQRGKKNLIEGSGLACFDMDEVEKLEELRNKLTNDKYVFCIFVSPSGNGLKVLVKIPKVQSDSEYKSYWISIAEHFNLPENDEASKDISRACYMSYDENPYINRDSETYIDKIEIAEKSLHKSAVSSSQKLRIKREYNGEKNELIDKIKSSITMEQVLSHLGVDTSVNPTDCPFHDCSQRCLSFHSEVAHCFDTDCEGDDSWNIFSFVQKIKSFNSGEAVEWLANFAGLKQEFDASREEYLNRNVDKEQPRGWALSLSIVDLAAKHNLKQCPKCLNGFEFKDSHGLYRCKTCRYGGGLKKFAELCVNKNQVNNEKTRKREG